MKYGATWLVTSVALVCFGCVPDPAKKGDDGAGGSIAISTGGSGASGSTSSSAGAGGDPAGGAGGDGVAGTTGGEAGATGSVGGDTGSAGLSGTAGTTGSAGATGTAGATGAAGATGGAGATGTAGTTGGAGATGAAGSSGGHAGGSAGTTGTAGAGGTGGVVGPPPSPCDRAAWTFTPSVVCTANCAGMTAANKLPSNAIDGDLNTRYTTGIDQGTKGPENVVLKFPTSVSLTGLSLYSKAATDYPVAYHVEYSTDGATFMSFAPDLAGPGVATLLVTFPARTTMRALRITQTGVGTHWWSIYEMTVVGCTVVPAAP
jgi:hypothetical protein